jgi:hypothetical protein
MQPGTTAEQGAHEFSFYPVYLFVAKVDFFQTIFSEMLRPAILQSVFAPFLDPTLRNFIFGWPVPWLAGMVVRIEGFATARKNERKKRDQFNPLCFHV